MSADCIFCAIVAGKSPADKVFEDDQAVVFRDINGLTDVHLQVIPKEHLAAIDDFSQNQAELLGRLFLIAKQMGNEHSPQHGYRLAVHGGGQQDIQHLHIQVMGGHKHLGKPAKDYKGVSKS